MLWCLISAPLLWAQSTGREVTDQQLIWVGYHSTLELNKGWSLNFEVEERRFINPDRQHQFLARGQVRHALGKNWDAVGGFAYFLQSPHNPFATEVLVVPELRLHIQLDYKQPLEKLMITHRYRAERRFFRNTAGGELADGYTANYRFRYRLGLEYPLVKLGQQRLKGKLSDEIMVNAGERITHNWFDQNRLYAGLSYPVHKNVSVEAGYLKWFQQRASGNQFYDRDIIRLIVSHKLDLKRKEADVEI
ncbi:uncharacterized protein DUF2490 [Pontibacter ummariensis]|uniref:DUF2490 domain-containing protein n=2 Tax=Pontibacter ummariensis TaxID=1610492 RepID=A0A239CGS1_9BACT|nr:uncharacterized protein DUF2490 [Pontibacter ummariensis]SNS19436.1 Protein of unknown function [Pontibacter ummariensis]